MLKAYVQGIGKPQSTSMAGEGSPSHLAASWFRVHPALCVRDDVDSLLSGVQNSQPHAGDC